MTVTYPDVTVQLSGEDSNAFTIMCLVSRGIARAHGPETAAAYRAEALQSESYDDLLSHAMNTVNVE